MGACTPPNSDARGRREAKRRDKWGVLDFIPKQLNSRLNLQLRRTRRVVGDSVLHTRKVCVREGTDGAARQVPAQPPATRRGKHMDLIAYNPMIANTRERLTEISRTFPRAIIGLQGTKAW